MTDETVVKEVELDPLNENPVVEAAESEAELTPEGEPSTPVEEAPDNVQLRINKITAEKYAEKRRAEELEKRLAELESAKSALPSEAPKLEDFDYDDAKHTEAVIQYQVRKQLEAQANTQKQQAQQTAQQAKAAEFAAKEAEFGAKNPDYAEAVGNIPRLHPDTLDAIYSLENGPQMAHYLGKHLDVAYEIASAPPHIAAVKLGQISATLQVKAHKVSTTSAPEPVENLGGAGGASAKPPADPRLAGVTFS
jgi:vacuolar-type H+-ATPase subunit I/STV1